MLLGTQVNQVYSVLKSDFQKGIDEAKPIADVLYETVPSEGADNLYDWLAHIPGFRRWYDSQPRVKRNVTEKNFRVTNKRYGDTLAISVDKVNDNQLVSFRPQIKAMGKVGTLLNDELVFDLFNYGFTTVDGNNESVAGYDGLSWFNDAHPVGNSTIDNKGTAVLSETAYQAAYQTLIGYKVQPDKMSTPRPLNGSFKMLLVVPPQLYGTAKEIIVNERKASGATNTWVGSADLLVAPYLTSATAWFLVNVGGAASPIFVQDRESLQIVEKTPTNDTEAFMLDEIIVGAKRRCAALVTYPWLSYGSNGTTT